MTRARIDLTDLDDTPPQKNPTKLRQISEGAGFPSRPAVQSPPGVEHLPTTNQFQRPARQTGNRHIAINVRVDPETADRLYKLRDHHKSRKRALADVIEEATQLLYDRDFGDQ